MPRVPKTYVPARHTTSPVHENSHGRQASNATAWYRAKLTAYGQSIRPAATAAGLPRRGSSGNRWRPADSWLTLLIHHSPLPACWGFANSPTVPRPRGGRTNEPGDGGVIGRR